MKVQNRHALKVQLVDNAEKFQNKNAIKVKVEGGGGGTITVDDALNSESENPVQNKVLTHVIDQLGNDVTGKQDTLTAGENITIEDNVISATGGGGGDGLLVRSQTPTSPEMPLLCLADGPVTTVEQLYNAWAERRPLYGVCSSLLNLNGSPESEGTICLLQLSASINNPDVTNLTQAYDSTNKVFTRNIAVSIIATGQDSYVQLRTGYLKANSTYVILVDDGAPRRVLSNIPVRGTQAPTSSTIGDTGQLYIHFNTSVGIFAIYVCQKEQMGPDEPFTYTWRKVYETTVN